MRSLKKYFKLSVDYEIALTHILTKKTQTVVASLAVAIGIAAFTFLNSLVLGFNRDSEETLFKSIPHIRLFIDDDVSTPFIKNESNKYTAVITNPKITNSSKKLLNPEYLISQIKSRDYVENAASWMNINLFYNNGVAQLNGTSSGVNILEADALFDIKATVVEGDITELLSTSNGIIIGVGIAENLNVRLNDNISVVSAMGIIKVMKIVALFKTSNSLVDKTKSYMNLSSAQQLMAQGPDYLTDLYIKVKNPYDATKYTKDLKLLSGYDVESWQVANESALSQSKTRALMMRSISFIILLVAAFTIYNVINMTVKQKMHDIAILKAQGFGGRSVVKIFLTEALIIGFLGTISGMVLGAILVNILSKVYIGGENEYFPIQFEPTIMIVSLIVGLAVTAIAGYFPARHAAKVDPTTIFRS